MIDALENSEKETKGDWRGKEALVASNRSPGLFEKVTFEQILEGGEGFIHVKTSRKRVVGREAMD